MKPLRLIITLCAALALLAAAAPAASADAGPLKRGDRGARVAHVQRILHLHADGIFGRSTLRAVKRFQRRHHLTPDGIVGPAFWRTASAVKARGRRHAAGRSGAKVTGRGPSVALLQRKLGIAADGVFGPGTARAVKRFQRAHGLTPDGAVGPATWAALGVSGRHPVLKRTSLRSPGGGGRRSGLPVRILRAIAAANRIAHLPYIYGGGHGSFRASGYDCSGSVSYVLHAAGALSAPLDSGQMMSYGRAGHGRWITIYANPGHAYMTINGRRFDTSGMDDGTRWDRRARPAGGYVVRHPPGL